jgi:hypothetical protein
MPSKKRVHLQQFGIILLLNLDLTYIRNPREKENYVMPFYLLKTYIRNPEIETKLFLCPSTSSATERMCRGPILRLPKDIESMTMAHEPNKLLLHPIRSIKSAKIRFIQLLLNMHGMLWYLLNPHANLLHACI